MHLKYNLTYKTSIYTWLFAQPLWEAKYTYIQYLIFLSQDLGKCLIVSVKDN